MTAKGNTLRFGAVFRDVVSEHLSGTPLPFASSHPPDQLCHFRMLLCPLLRQRQVVPQLLQQHCPLHGSCKRVPHLKHDNAQAVKIHLGVGEHRASCISASHILLKLSRPTAVMTCDSRVTQAMGLQ